MRVALFGAGFVGSPLVDALEEKDHEVEVFGRSRYDAFTDDGPDLSGFDAVVNLIGVPIVPPWTDRRLALIRDSRVRSAAALSRAARDAGAFYLQSSGTGVHSTGILKDIGTAWEHAIATDDYAICRFGLVIGDGGVARSLAPLFCIGLGGVFGSGDQRVAWIARDTLVERLVTIIETRASGIHELSQTTDARSFYRSIARGFSRPCIWRYPAWLLRLMLPRAHELFTADTDLDTTGNDTPDKAMRRTGLRC